MYVLYNKKIRLVDHENLPSSFINPAFPGEERQLIKVFLRKYKILILDIQRCLEKYLPLLNFESIQALHNIKKNLSNELKFVRIKAILKYSERDVVDFVSCYRHATFIFNQTLDVMAQNLSHFIEERAAVSNIKNNI
ncbi:MAG: hypothetical protein FJ333_09155 [Sphingomonadales bacterium]|nr:hypothetical protein [Sphingomonadales bacterium]